MTQSAAPDPSEATARRLPCGRDPLDVVDHARAAKSDEHERACPHCQAAIAAVGLIEDASTEIAALDRQVPAPASLLPAVMRSVWNELRRSTDISLQASGGTVLVTDRAITSVLQAALDELEQLRVHTCRVTEPIAATQRGSASQATGVGIEIKAAAAYNTDLPTLAERARADVAATLLRQFELTADEIDIEIVDVFVVGEAS